MKGKTEVLEAAAAEVAVVPAFALVALMMAPVLPTKVEVALKAGALTMVEVTVATTSETVTVLVNVEVKVVVCPYTTKGSSKAAVIEEKCIATTIFPKGMYQRMRFYQSLRVRYLYTIKCQERTDDSSNRLRYWFGRSVFQFEC